MFKLAVKKTFFFLLLSFTLLGLASSVRAQGNEGNADAFFGSTAEKDNFQSSLGLGDANPKIVIANVTRIALGFLGMIAVLIIMYAGWMWMTARGNVEQINKAKKTLLSAVIGLAIILSAFAIVSYILSKMVESTTGGTSEPPGGRDDFPGSDSFFIAATVPRNGDTDQVRNTMVAVFFNKNMASNVDLTGNLKVEKVADIDPVTGNSTPFGPVDVDGVLEIAGPRQISFKSSAACGDEQNTPNCFAAWSELKITVNAASGITSVDNQSLNCANGKCVFNFSTGADIDYGGPTAGIVPTQICVDDGTITADANTVGGWGRDDFSIASLSYYKQKPGQAEILASTIPGNNTTYQFSQYKYDTVGMSVGDQYIFKVAATDAGSAVASSTFNTTLKAGHCCNGIKDSGEDDVDCGGDCISCDQLKPVVFSISPAGGFCSNNKNTACLNNADCGGTNQCDKSKPNGAVGNFVTVFGKYFGSAAGKVYFSDGSGGFVEAKLANDAVAGNASCSDAWGQSAITVIVPVGTADGPIKVETAASQTDLTNDENGPKIFDFVANAIARPGLCALSPANGKLSDSITYQGVRLTGKSAQFGEVGQGVPAQSAFDNEKTGTASVPNIQIGDTTTFVLQGSLYSNYLPFKKDAEPHTGPSIISFEPDEGKVGQYVTIRGKGFGANKQTSKVFFGDKEASYDFPEVCQSSVWSDEQVIVKVPSGLVEGSQSLIKMEVGSFRIDSSKLATSTFKFDSSLPLRPSLCRLDPVMGQGNQEISLWGEYFGAKDDTKSKVRFTQDKDQSGAAITFWGVDGSAAGNPKPDKIVTSIPQTAASGPVRVVQDALIGNSMQLAIGVCKNNSDCGNPDTNFCCPTGSPEGGRCKAESGAKDTVQELCFPEIRSCVYEWEFATGATKKILCDGDAATPQCDPDPSKCPTDQPFCGADQTTGECVCSATPPADSCSGLSTSQCLSSNFCPNSPGQCSSDAGGVKATGATCQANCNDKAGCKGGACTYEAALDKCVKKDPVNTTQKLACDISDKTKDVENKDVIANCMNGKWQFATTKSCPAGWVLSAGKNSCVGSSCDICDSGFKCLAPTTTGNLTTGVCAVDQELCTGEAKCNAGDKCEVTDAASCECCCRIGKANADCCPGLSCGGTCGSDTTDDGAGFGQCTGCTVTTGGSVDQAASDAACNCSSTKGKSCDTAAALGLGACIDCAQYQTASECSAHASVCCFDSKSNVCRGGAGDKNIVTTDTPDIAYCPYYSCNAGNTACDATASTTGQFPDLAACNLKCNTTPPLGQSCEVTTVGNAEQCNTSACGAPGACLTSDGTPISTANCGTCCCAPGTTFNGLECVKDKSPCDGGSRGLFCGCSTDAQCGNPSAAGCGLDTCCRARPTVLEPTIPAKDKTDVCRNPLISATFSQKMNVASFSGNIILVGNYGIEQCPATTTYLTTIYNQKLSPIAKLWHWFAGLFGKSAGAIAGNFCAIDGTVGGYNDANDKGVLTFSPRQILDPDREYYVIIRGDASTTDAVPEGVLSDMKIGMAADTASSTFNSVTYNGKIWKFKTKPATASDDGICRLENVAINPANHNFFTAENNVDYKTRAQKNDDALGADFDTVDDSDKAFAAIALSGNGQPIASINSIYSWDWGWSSENPSVAAVTSANAYIADKSIQVVGAQNVKDAKTFVKAAAKITADVANPASVGQSKTGRSEVRVFLCENPWPPVDPANPSNWPWKDKDANCSINPASCKSYNFEFYYCRDNGEAGTADDLPAVNYPNTVIRGKASGTCDAGYNYNKACAVDGDCAKPAGTLTCVNNQCAGGPVAGGKCVTDQDCRTGGFCKFILKEYYFMRAQTPAITVLSVTPDQNGGRVAASWAAVPGASGYKLYYGTVKGAYSETIDVHNVTTYTVAGLTNEKKYYFAVTAYYYQSKDQSKAESGYSPEVEVTPKDTVAPNKPTGLTAVFASGEITMKWNKNSDDTKSYKVYYGTVSGNYGSSENVGDLAETTITNLSSGVTYYVAVSAIDAYGNESIKAEVTVN